MKAWTEKLPSSIDSASSAIKFRAFFLFDHAVREGNRPGNQTSVPFCSVSNSVRLQE